MNMKQSLKLLTVVNIVFAIGLSIFVYIFLPFAHGVSVDAATRNGNDYPELENWVLILSSLLPMIVIGGNTLIALKLRDRSNKLSLRMLSFFPILITFYVVIQYTKSLFA